MNDLDQSGSLKMPLIVHEIKTEFDQSKKPKTQSQMRVSSAGNNQGYIITSTHTSRKNSSPENYTNQQLFLPKDHALGIGSNNLQDTTDMLAKFVVQEKKTLRQNHKQVPLFENLRNIQKVIKFKRPSVDSEPRAIPKILAIESVLKSNTSYRNKRKLSQLQNLPNSRQDVHNIKNLKAQTMDYIFIPDVPLQSVKSIGEKRQPHKVPLDRPKYIQQINDFKDQEKLNIKEKAIAFKSKLVPDNFSLPQVTATLQNFYTKEQKYQQIFNNHNIQTLAQEFNMKDFNCRSQDTFIIPQTSARQSSNKPKVTGTKFLNTLDFNLQTRRDQTTFYNRRDADQQKQTSDETANSFIKQMNRTEINNLFSSQKVSIGSFCQSQSPLSDSFQRAIMKSQEFEEEGRDLVEKIHDSLQDNAMSLINRRPDDSPTKVKSQIKDNAMDVRHKNIQNRHAESSRKRDSIERYLSLGASESFSKKKNMQAEFRTSSAHRQLETDDGVLETKKSSFAQHQDKNYTYDQLRQLIESKPIKESGSSRKVAENRSRLAEPQKQKKNKSVNQGCYSLHTTHITKATTFTDHQQQQQLFKQQANLMQQIAIKNAEKKSQAKNTWRDQNTKQKAATKIQREVKAKEPGSLTQTMFQGIGTSSLSAKSGRLEVETRKELNSSVDPKEPQTSESFGKKSKLKQLNKDTEEAKDQQNNSTQPKEIKYFDPKVKIGQGKHGPVDLVIVNVGKEKELRALKRINKFSIDNPKSIEHVKNEKTVLKLLVNKDSRQQLDFIVQLYETFTDEQSVCFLFEYLSGQDLFWVVQNEHNLFLGKTKNGGRRQWVLFYCAELLVALHTLHSRQIIYRDLKPDNVMIDSEGHIKLIDFGFSKRLSAERNQRTFTNCGTLGYTAPEVITGKSGYSFQADLWSFGILLVELLTGSLPFEEKTDPVAIQTAIIVGDVRYQREGVDQTVRDMLQQIFEVEPNLRITLEGIMSHKVFMADQNSSFWKSVATKTLSNGEVPYKPNPMKYKYLLQNQYEMVSNISQNSEEPLSPTPNEGLAAKISPKKAPKMLGNFTIYKVNKEFENF